MYTALIIEGKKTYISSLIDGNVNIDTVRQLAGHVDVQTTYNSYVYDRSSDPEKVKLIESALDEKPTQTYPKN